jgi:hypothetical protein
MTRGERQIQPELRAQVGDGPIKGRLLGYFLAEVGSPSPEQSVEAPVVGVYGEDLHIAEARLEGVLTKQRGTHDGSGRCGLGVSHGAGQAGDNAPAVLISFPC